MRFPRSMLTSTSTAIMLLCMSGCAYIIPPEQNAPRNNTVEGEVRSPELNDTILRPRSVVPAIVPQVPAAHMATPMAITPVVAAVPGDMMPESLRAAPIADIGRRVPVENQSFEVSAMGYPSINNIPPRPEMNGPGSAQERMTDTQSTLELDRALADERAATLARDAAAEPSMLPLVPAVSMPLVAPQDLPPAVVTPAPQTRRLPVMNQTTEPTFSALPAVSAVSVTSVANPIPESTGEMPKMVANTVPQSQRMLPNIPAFEPPVPSVTVPASVAAISVPLSKSLAAPVFVPAPPVVAAASGHAPLRQGDFDPMAVADNVPATVTSVALPHGNGYAVNRYIAPSRYYDRRYQ